MKIVPFFYISIALVLIASQTNACIEINSNIYHIQAIQATDDPDILITTIVVGSKEETIDLAFSISNNYLMKVIPDGVMIDHSVPTVLKVQSMTYFENDSGEYVLYEHDNLRLTYLVTSLNVDKNNVRGLVYEKLDRIYIETSDYSPNPGLTPLQFIGTVTTQKIESSGLVLFPMFDWTIINELDIGLTLQGSNDDCSRIDRNFFRLVSNDFEHIISVTPSDNILYNLISDKLQILSFDTTSKSSIIRSYGAHNNESSSFSITSEELISIIVGDIDRSSEELVLPLDRSTSIFLFSAIVLLVFGAISVYKRKQ